MSGTGQLPSRNGLPTTSGEAQANNQRLPSENFKTAQRNVKTAITRASTTGLKTAEQAFNFMDDTTAVYDALGLKTIDNLRKKLIVIAGMIETDKHFFDFIKNTDGLLSSKERQGLREVAKAHLDLTPRTDNLPVIKNAITALQAALEKQDYRTGEISPTETADISKDVENSPVDGEDPEEEDPFNAETLLPDDDIKAHDLIPSTVGFNNSGGTPVPPVVTPNTRSSVEDHEASSRSSPRARTNPASHGQPVTCPVCDEGHELFRCKSSDLPRYLARNGLCVHCMSNRHETHMCPLQNAGSSPYFAGSFVKKHPENGGRFMTQNTKIVASTPREKSQSNFPSLSDSDEKEDIVSARTPAPRARKEESSDEESENECRAAERTTKTKTNGKWLSYHDLDAILPKFSGEALRYKKFMTTFESLGMHNPRLDDVMRLSLLEKKLIGEAKGFLCELTKPRDSLEATLSNIRETFEKDTSEVTEALQQFSQLSFHETDYKRAARQLMESRSLIRRLRDLGEDVNTPSFVRSFMVKLPEQMLCNIRQLFEDGSQPSVDDIISIYDKSLRDKVFAQRFRSAKVADRLKEIPDESVMATSQISSNPTKPNGNFAPGAGTDSTKTPASPLPNASKVSNNSSTNSKKRNKGGKDPQASNKSNNSVNQSKVDNQGSSGGNSLGYFGTQQTFYQGNPAPRSQGNAPSANSASVQPKPRPANMKGQPGEKLEPCYKHGRGYDARFIAHTFPRDSDTASKCCFICGPGHSILQCVRPSYEVREFFRSSGSCHNCAQRNHGTEECPSFSSCAYCQGKHNTGGCTLKEYYRDPRNYPADAPAPVLSEFFRGPFGGSQ